MSASTPTAIGAIASIRMIKHPLVDTCADERARHPSDHETVVSMPLRVFFTAIVLL
jgi:hypothetical protein